MIFLEFSDSSIRIVQKSWREEHRRLLKDLFDDIQDKWYFNQTSRLLTEWSREPRLLSLEQDKFQSNVCRFAEFKTGKSDLSYEEAVKLLRDMSVVKNEQSRVLYDAFEIQRTEIARQQQIITCLTYRCALENLPQKDAPIMEKPQGTHSATAAWQKMWKFAVEAELDRMIVEYIDPESPLLALPPPTTSGTTSANPATVNQPKPPRSLKKLLQSDFDYWTSQHRSRKALLEIARQSKNVPTVADHTGKADVPAGVAVVAGVTVTSGTVALAAPKAQTPAINTMPASKAQTPALNTMPATWTTGKYVRVESYRPPYDKWPSFSHGHTLYGELSNNIHTYQKSYDIDETNFTKSQRTILEWLDPRDLDKSLEDGRETVDWQDQWTKRILTT